MKVIHVNFGGGCGGAAIAAKRISSALIRSGVTSEVWVARGAGDVPGVQCIKRGLFQKLDSAKNISVQWVISFFLKGKDRSVNIFPSRLVHQLNASDADVIHLHWVNAEMVSIAQLAKLKKPVVWTLHDMWAFCGGEHYTTASRYVDGYSKESCQLSANSHKLKIDLDRWTFLRKQNHWENWRPHIVTPSKWLAGCAADSVLFKDAVITVVPNCVALNQFQPMNSRACKQEFGLAEDKKIVLFGACAPGDLRKGGDLLVEALRQLTNPERYQLVVFGADQFTAVSGVNVKAVGSIYDADKMARLYNAADLFVAPSRQDNLPNTCVEATACGVPVVAFNIGGLPDIVRHQQNGYLATPFDAADLAKGIEWVLGGARSLEPGGQRGDSDQRPDAGECNLGTCAREHALASFSEETVAAQYKAVYEVVLGVDS